MNTLGVFVVELFRLNGVLLYEGDRIVRDLDLTSARWQVLGALELAGRPQSVSQIARNMGLARQSVQRITNELHHDGFITFEDNPDHRRAKNLVLTSHGRKAFSAAMRRQAQWSRNLLAASGVTERQLAGAVATFRRLREAVTETQQ
jgi:DNA-binding MarR family transcriptional regulator